MTCPIGIPGIDSKQPAVIAASVTAQLLQVREARQAVARAVRPVAITPLVPYRPPPLAGTTALQRP